MATTLADYTTPCLMVPELRGRDTVSVIQELSQTLQRENRIPDMLTFYHAAMNHEFLVSNDMEAGMAFPHAQLPGLKEPVFAVGRSNEPLYWGAKAMRTVRLVFLIATPATDSTQYLLLISSLARLSLDTVRMEKLRGTRSAEEMFDVLKQVNLHTGHAGNLADKGAG